MVGRTGVAGGWTLGGGARFLILTVSTSPPCYQTSPTVFRKLTYRFLFYFLCFGHSVHKFERELDFFLVEEFEVSRRKTSVSHPSASRIYAA